MNKALVCVLSLGAALAGGAAMQRASAQDQTAQPGQPTRANVWIQNRGDSEAVPVTIQNGPPLRVVVAGVPSVIIDPGSAIQVRVDAQSWAYRAVSIGAGQDPVPLLNTAGADGWEAVGVTLASPTGTVILMKRPN